MEIRKEDPKVQSLKKPESLGVKGIKENSQAELRELPWRLPFCLKGDAVLRQLFAEFLYQRVAKCCPSRLYLCCQCLCSVAMKSGCSHQLTHS